MRALLHLKKLQKLGDRVKTFKILKFKLNHSIWTHKTYTFGYNLILFSLFKYKCFLSIYWFSLTHKMYTFHILNVVRIILLNPFGKSFERITLFVQVLSISNFRVYDKQHFYVKKFSLEGDALRQRVICLVKFLYCLSSSAWGHLLLRDVRQLKEKRYTTRRKHLG